MKVTNITAQKKNPNRFNLFVDDLFCFSVSATGIARYHLYQGKEIDEELLSEIYKEELYRRFLDRGAEYLSKYTKSERDARLYLRKLWKKKQGDWFREDLELDWEDLFDRVLTQLTKYGYVNDERFAQQFVESRMKGRPRSKSILISELRSKGVSSETAAEVISSSGADNSELIRSVYSKKFRDQDFDLSDRKKVDFLRRKGFNWDEISNLAKELKDDIEK